MQLSFTLHLPSVTTLRRGFVCCVAGANGRRADPLIFKKVDFFQQRGEGEEKRDARLELDPDTRMLSITDEKNGAEKATYLAVPYDVITKIVYERSAHRRYGAGVLVSPFLLLTKGKKHWLTIEFSGVAAYPEGYAYLRLEKDNYRRILSAIEAATGLEKEEILDKS